MPTPFESAQLNLQLFGLRRESVLREALAWFLGEFNPESFEDMVATLSSDRNASFRMVLGYWDMAASLVTTGAVDGDAFRAAHGEILPPSRRSSRISPKCGRRAPNRSSASTWNQS
jgi:hypothetical protein